MIISWTQGYNNPWKSNKKRWYKSAKEIKKTKRTIKQLQVTMHYTINYCQNLNKFPSAHAEFYNYFFFFCKFQEIFNSFTQEITQAENARLVFFWFQVTGTFLVNKWLNEIRNVSTARRLFKKKRYCHSKKEYQHLFFIN